MYSIFPCFLSPKKQPSPTFFLAAAVGHTRTSCTRTLGHVHPARCRTAGFREYCHRFPTAADYINVRFLKISSALYRLYICASCWLHHRDTPDRTTLRGLNDRRCADLPRLLWCRRHYDRHHNHCCCYGLLPPCNPTGYIDLQEEPTASTRP